MQKIVRWRPLVVMVLLITYVAVPDSSLPKSEIVSYAFVAPVQLSSMYWVSFSDVSAQADLLNIVI